MYQRCYVARQAKTSAYDESKVYRTFRYSIKLTPITCCLLKRATVFGDSTLLNTEIDGLLSDYVRLRMLIDSMPKGCELCLDKLLIML